MPQIVIVCAGFLVYRTITFVGENPTQSLGFTSSQFRRRYSVKLPEAGGLGRGKYRYAQATWYHTRPKKSYQIGRLFVKQNDMKRIRDAGAVSRGG